MKKVISMFLCVLMLFLIPASMVRASQGQGLDDSRIDFQNWAEDTKYVLTSPKNWDSFNWGTFILCVGITTIIHENDGSIQHHFQERRSHNANHFAEIGNQVPVAGAAYLTGAYFLGNEQQRKTAVVGLESAGMAVLATEALSYATHRQRPNGEDNNSFPSTHAAAAFAMATVFANEYKHEKFISPLAYGLATLTAYGRLNDNKHWGSDVFVGGLIGYYSAKTVLRLNKSRNCQLQPYIGDNKTGVLVRKQF